MISALRRRLRADDDGFTIMEVLVAMIVIAVGLLGLMAMQVRSIETLGLAKQRQTATALTSRAVEQLRALPYTTVSGGLACADLVGSSDPNLTVSGSASACTATFAPSYDASISEVAVTTTGAPAVPLNPHVQAASGTLVGGVQYTVRDYVTRVNSNASVDAGYWLTVITTWSSGLTGNRTKSIALRSQLYSPQGCLANTTHPFSGPCQAFFYSDAGTIGGSVTVQSTRAGLPIVDGLGAATGSVAFQGMSSRVQSEQVVSSQSIASTSGWKLTDTAGTTTNAGSVTGSSSADTDPATGTSTSPTSATSVIQSGSTTGPSSGGGNQLTLTQGAGDAGSAFSTMSTTGTPACLDNAGTAVSNGRTCSSALISNADATSAVLSLNPGARGLVLGDVAATSATSRAYGARYLTSGTNHCTATSGTGCIAAGITRTLGTIRSGVFPNVGSSDTITGATGASVTSKFGASPLPLVRVSGYTDTAKSEVGNGAATLTPTRAGSLVYWSETGTSGFTTVDLATAGTATYTIPSTTATYLNGTNPVTVITVSGTVTSTAPANTGTGASPCSTAACLIKSSGGSVVVRLTYSIKSGGTVVGEFTTTVDLGTALSQTSYKAAPVA